MKQPTPGPWGIMTDPTELSCQGIFHRYEYEPGEFAKVWIAREVATENAMLIANAPALLTGLKSFLQMHGNCQFHGCPELRALVASIEGK